MSILYSLDDKSKENTLHPLDTEGKLNVHKTFRRPAERLLNVLGAFNLRHVSRRAGEEFQDFAVRGNKLLHRNPNNIW